jgi:hypothetical protein
MRVLRAAFIRTTNDPEFIAEAKGKNLDITPTRGEDFEALAKDVVTQPPEMVGGIKKLMTQ